MQASRNSGYRITAAAVILGIAAFLAVAMLQTDTSYRLPSAEYGPEYDHGEARAALSIADEPEPVDGSGSMVGRHPVESRASCIIGRVLDFADNPVEDCVVECSDVAPRTAGVPDAWVAKPDALGYFELALPHGVYKLSAKAPGYCMWPARYRTAVPGQGDPVRIYMHPAVAFKLTVTDRISGRQIAVPHSAQVRVQVDGQDVPPNARLRVAPELCVMGATGLDVAHEEIVVRVMGTDLGGRIVPESDVAVSVGVPGLRIDPIRLSLREAQAMNTGVSLYASVVDGWVLGSLDVGYDHGESIQTPLVVKLRLGQGQELQFWGLDMGGDYLLPLRPGAGTAEVGCATYSMQGFAVEIPTAAYATLPIRLRRGGDISVAMVDRRTHECVPFRDLEVTRSDGQRSTPVLRRPGIWHSRDEYRIWNLEEGEYAVRARDEHGDSRERTVTVVRGGVHDVRLFAGVGR